MLLDAKLEVGNLESAHLCGIGTDRSSGIGGQSSEVARGYRIVAQDANIAFKHTATACSDHNYPLAPTETCSVESLPKQTVTKQTVDSSGGDVNTGACSADLSTSKAGGEVTAEPNPRSSGSVTQLSLSTRCDGASDQSSDVAGREVTSGATPKQQQQQQQHHQKDKHNIQTPSAASSADDKRRAGKAPSTNQTHTATVQTSPLILATATATAATIPTSNEPIVCHYCQKQFTRPSSLTTHIYTHTGEKPHECTFPECKKRFSVLSNLRRHLKLHKKHDVGGSGGDTSFAASTSTMSWADHSGLIATSSGFDEKEAMDTKGNRVSKLPIYPLTHHYYHQYRHHHHRRHCQQQQQQQHQQQKPMPLASQPTINSTSPLDVFPTGTGRRYTSGHYAAPQPFSSMSRRTSDSVGPANLLLTQSYSFPVMELPGAQCPNADEPGRTCKRRKTMSDMPASNPLDFWVSPFKFESPQNGVATSDSVSNPSSTFNTNMDFANSLESMVAATNKYAQATTASTTANVAATAPTITATAWPQGRTVSDAPLKMLEKLYDFAPPITDTINSSIPVVDNGCGSGSSSSSSSGIGNNGSDIVDKLLATPSTAAATSNNGGSVVQQQQQQQHLLPSLASSQIGDMIDIFATVATDAPSDSVCAINNGNTAAAATVTNSDDAAVSSLPLAASLGGALNDLDLSLLSSSAAGEGATSLAQKASDDGSCAAQAKSKDTMIPASMPCLVNHSDHYYWQPRQKQQQQQQQQQQDLDNILLFQPASSEAGDTNMFWA